MPIVQCDNAVAFGQSRAVRVGTRITTPDGSSIVLERQPDADSRDYAELRPRGSACAETRPHLRPLRCPSGSGNRSGSRLP